MRLLSTRSSTRLNEPSLACWGGTRICISCRKCLASPGALRFKMERSCHASALSGQTENTQQISQTLVEMESTNVWGMLAVRGQRKETRILTTSLKRFAHFMILVRCRVL
ncbi:hypothetical protein MESS2_750005 [Mesorhizobium metallidurans STM 2683]|uniref:Uncharacterized protein n=1 Tax=Mesorhizobium metallidurans STM 2683 TaxID=1297569 RepID=M5F975_9HYPH|nr:hypothetical protein MESS2_750005 [Mesorhizobium metallidurans STM 2683]